MSIKTAVYNRITVCSTPAMPYSSPVNTFGSHCSMLGHAWQHTGTIMARPGGKYALRRRTRRCRVCGQTDITEYEVDWWYACPGLPDLLAMPTHLSEFQSPPRHSTGGDSRRKAPMPDANAAQVTELLTALRDATRADSLDWTVQHTSAQLMPRTSTWLDSAAISIHAQTTPNGRMAYVLWVSPTLGEPFSMAYEPALRGPETPEYLLVAETHRLATNRPDPARPATIAALIGQITAKAEVARTRADLKGRGQAKT